MFDIIFWLTMFALLILNHFWLMRIVKNDGVPIAPLCFGVILFGTIMSYSLIHIVAAYG